MPNYPTNTMTQQSNWAGEVTPSAQRAWNTPWTGRDTRFPLENPGSLTNPNMSNNLPAEVVESPTNLNEAFLGSLKATLLRNKGNFIVATFLIGTQNTMSWEGILYEVGNDYITIYQPGRDRYVVIDMYSLKYMEFYDTARREMCDRILAEQGMDGRNALLGMTDMPMADNNGMGGMNIMGGMNTMGGMTGSNVLDTRNMGNNSLASGGREW